MMPDTAARDLVRFRCTCGRSVVCETGSVADTYRACWRCRQHGVPADFGDLRRLG